jgi:hypothetical protein
MSTEWGARDEQPILSTSTNPCITRADGTHENIEYGYTKDAKSTALQYIIKSKLTLSLISSSFPKTLHYQKTL